MALTWEICIRVFFSPTDFFDGGGAGAFTTGDLRSSSLGKEWKHISIFRMKMLFLSKSSQNSSSSGLTGSGST
jgi:hypothetical protein